MVQEFLEAEEDYRVVTVGYKALPFYVSRKPREGEFRTNFEWNEEVVPHRISEFPELKHVAELAAKIESLCCRLHWMRQDRSYQYHHIRLSDNDVRLPMRQRRRQKRRLQ